VLPESDVSLAGGLALGAVDGGGVGELDLVACVGRGNDPCAAPTLECEGAVVTEGRGGPVVAVGDAEVAVVTPRDPVTDPLSGSLLPLRRATPTASVREAVGVSAGLDDVTW